MICITFKQMTTLHDTPKRGPLLNSNIQSPTNDEANLLQNEYFCASALVIHHQYFFHCWLHMISLYFAWALFPRSSTKVWSNVCMVQVQTKNQPKYSNLEFFLLCNMKTADCTMRAQINAYGQGGPRTADGRMHQYPTKVLQLRNWKMSRQFFSQMWVSGALLASRPEHKKGMCIKDLNAKH